MEEAGVVPNVISFSSAIAAYAKTAQPDAAIGLLQRMRAQAPRPETLALALTPKPSPYPSPSPSPSP